MRLMKAIALLSVLTLVACGYQPLYGSKQQNIAKSDLSEVTIAAVEGRLGDSVRLHLQNEMAPFGARRAALYRLHVSLDEDRIDLGVQKDRTATRFDFRIYARIQLVSLQSNTVVFEASPHTSASYDVVASDFATLMAERDAERRAAEQLSRDITLHISLFLERERQRQS